MLKDIHIQPTEAELAIEAMTRDAQRIIDNVARLHKKASEVSQSRLSTGTMHLETAMLWIKEGAKTL